MAKHNYAAFSPNDMKDAKRGYPDFDLRGYANSRGLEFMHHDTPAGFRAVVAGEAELQSNIVRGTVPGGEYGVMAHEGLQIRWSNDSADWDGTYYGVRILHGDQKLRARDLVLPLLPGWELFGTAGEMLPARVPCTVAGVRLPETTGTWPYLRIDTRGTCPPISFANRTKLDSFLGECGWIVSGEPLPDPQSLAQLVADPVATILHDHYEDGLFQIVVWYGTLVVRRNGYLRPDALDELGLVTSQIAERLRQLCRPLAEPRPFDVELHRPLSSQAVLIPRGFHPIEVWRKWAIETATRLGLALENPYLYHRAFPALPAPGMAHVVMRGAIPNVGWGRLAVHRECEVTRPVVTVAAPSSSGRTPPGGLVYPGVRLEVADGLLAVWSSTSWWGNPNVIDLSPFLSAAATAITDWRGGSPQTRHAPGGGP